jgi:hypothetical protein
MVATCVFEALLLSALAFASTPAAAQNRDRLTIWKPSQRHLEMPIQVRTEDTGLTLGALSVWCQYWYYGKPSFERRAREGEIVFRCTQMNIYTRTTKTFAIALREPKKTEARVQAKMGFNPDGSIMTEQQMIVGFKRLAEIFKARYSIKEIHPDAYHCTGTDEDALLPQFLKEDCGS